MSPGGLGPRAGDLTFLAETILEDLRSQSAGNKREPLGGSEKFLRNESGLPRNKIAPGPVTPGFLEFLVVRPGRN